MVLRCLVVLSVASACGEVKRPVDAGAVGGDAIDEAATTYRGTRDVVAPVTFGGKLGDQNFCTYMITLKQLVIELAITPSGQVRTGHVQDLNVETTTADCPNGTIPPNIAMYTLASATPSQTGMTLAFQGAASNEPTVDLVVELSTAGSAHQASLGFHRSNASPPLDWSVVTTLALSAQ